VAYCTAADVKVYVGTTVLDADLTAMIADADRDILSFFTKQGVAVDSDAAKTASILLTRAAVAERFYLTGENPTSYSSGDYTQSGAADQLALSKKLSADALKILDEYIGFASGASSGVIIVPNADDVYLEMR
jgi:hypothetical protein